MSCLVAVGARLSGFVESAKVSAMNITIDGFPIACSRKVFENLGLQSKSFVLSDMGLVKGKTSVDDHVIQELSEEIKKTITERDLNAKNEYFSPKNRWMLLVVKNAAPYPVFSKLSACV